MKISDLSLLNSVSAPSVSPDGRQIVFSVSRADVPADTYVGQVWHVPADGSSPAERMTRGLHDSSPVFSPDGALIAFLRSTGAAAPQIHVVRANGGEPVAVTAQKLGVSQFSWSPDSRRLIFVSRVPERGRYGTIEGIAPTSEPARRITTTRYLSNGLGWATDRFAQVFIVDVPDVTAEPYVAPVPSLDDEHPVVSASDGLPNAVQVTFDETDHAHPRFTPDNRAVTFVSAAHADRDSDLRSSAWAVGISADGALTETTEIVGVAADLGIDDVIATPSGTTFVLAESVGPTGLDFVGSNTALYAVDQPGSVPRLLTDPETVDLGSTSFSLMGDDAVLVQDTTRGTLQLLLVDAAGTSQRLTAGALEITGHDASGDIIAVAVADADSTGDIAVLRGGALHRLTDFSAPLRTNGIATANEIVVETRDGSEVHGWVLLPEGEGPHPTLLVIHGGPYAQFTGSIFDEAQVYVDAGYGVVMGNPRGAAGYGQAFGRAIKGAMGTVDLTDVIDLLDGATAKYSQLDAGRVGIMGGSYGGYLTAWTIAHEHRFAGAIVERGFLDPEFFTGTSDIGTFFSEQYTGADPADMARQSPQAVVSQVTTPTFVIHSEDDLRCPLSQAERYHLGLVRAGVDTEMLIFPGENHELSRSGNPRHRVQRFEAILEWWNRHLPVGA